MFWKLRNHQQLQTTKLPHKMNVKPPIQKGEKAQRTCIACRVTNDQDLLLRFVIAPDGEIVVDLDSKLPGRGAYCCNNKICLTNAVQRRAFTRALKAETNPVTANELIETVLKQMQGRILGYIGLSNKAGKLVSGGSMVTDAIKGKDKPGLVFVATDTSAPIAEKIIQTAINNKVQHFRCLTKEHFGDMLGKAPKSALAIKQGGFVAKLNNEIKRYINFLGEVH